MLEGVFASKALPFFFWKLRRVWRGCGWVLGSVLREMAEPSEEKDEAELRRRLLRDLRLALGDPEEARFFGVEEQGPSLTHQLGFEKVRP